MAQKYKTKARNPQTQLGDQPDEHFVFSTCEIACLPNQLNQLVLSQQNASFTLHLPDLHVKENGEVRLYEIAKGDEGKLVGCYEFLLNNYVKAYQELSRNAIQLRVQISEQYVVTYDVFIEKTEEALQRLIKEHETARKFHMQNDDISSIDSFLPHQINHQNLQDIYQQIKIDQASPLLVNQRFWSPKRERPNVYKHPRLPIQEKIENMNSTLAEQKPRTLLTKLHKTFSTTSADLDFSISKKEVNVDQMDVQSLPQTVDRFHTFKQLYRVIECDSKIILPDELEEHQRSRRNEKKPFQLIPKKHKISKKVQNFQMTAKYIAFIMIMIIAASLIISTFQMFPEKDYVRKVRRSKF